VSNRPINPPGWPMPKGYVNAVAARGELVFVAGQVGWTAEQRFEAKDLAGQVAQALRNTVEVLAAAGAGPRDIVRMTWYVTDKQEYLAQLGEIGRSYREIIGRHFVAMTLVEVAALLEDDAKIEIETTAVISDEDRAPAKEGAAP
jgi:enamine deaminase RidA (YjgF/YER057c/UK114 family)